MPQRSTLIPGEPAPVFASPRVPSMLASPPIVDNDNGNPDLVLECEGDHELPMLLCECMYGMGFQVVSCHARVQDGRTQVRLTVAESDGSPLCTPRRRHAMALADALSC